MQIAPLLRSASMGVYAKRASARVQLTIEESVAITELVKSETYICIFTLYSGVKNTFRRKVTVLTATINSDV